MLHRMVRGVNAQTGQQRAARVAATEQRLVDAAARLFLRHGYVATTLSAVAQEAGVAERTVYLRFATKAALFKRTVDVALVGDTEPVDVEHRDWTQRALTAPTIAERIRFAAQNTGEMMGRVGALLAVAEQAAALEPDIAAAAQAARHATRDQLRQFWRAAASDGLLPSDADLDWLIDTAVMTCSADSYLHAHRTLGWSADTYAHWLEATWLHITRTTSTTGSTGASGKNPPPMNRPTLALSKGSALEHVDKRMRGDCGLPKTGFGHPPHDPER
jgi:AcrR family transcriptional regulator